MNDLITIVQERVGASAVAPPASAAAPGPRASPIAEHRLAALIDRREPLLAETPLAQALEFFAGEPPLRLAPVVGPHREPLGALYERDVRKLVFNPLAQALLSNRGLAGGLRRMVRPCPTEDVGAPVERLLDSYVTGGNEAGLIVTRSGCYLGVLSGEALLRLVNEREVALAAELNPLTRLPGNRLIEAHLEQALTEPMARTLAYFDFDHFKVFNDNYGFIAGDLAIQMFARLLGGAAGDLRGFAGHVGGDDFFLSLPLSVTPGITAITRLIRRFSSEAAALYSAEDRKAGGLRGLDRNGSPVFAPLMSVSAGVIALDGRARQISVAELSSALGHAKKRAKKAPWQVWVESVPLAA